MKKLLLVLLVSLTTQLSISQSNSPCGFLPPTILPVGATCINTNGTTVGATYSNNNQNGGTPPCASPGAPDVWYSFIAPPGGDVNIQTQAGSITDGGMALYGGNCPNLNLIECNDDSGPGLMPFIAATGLTPGALYYVRFWEFGGGGGPGNGNGNGNNNTGTFSICLSIPSPLVSNVNCQNPDPICSGTPINFTANTGAPEASQTNPGNDYGCLFTTPNPSWYYLEIDQGGNLVIDISAGSDVDFAIWGPYPNLTTAIGNCESYPSPQDCSYSTSEIEQVNLPNVANSEVYVLLVTNYANTVQNINVNNNGGTATTNCGIVVLPIELAMWDAKKFGREVRMNWMTASEVNNSHFIVQKSTDLQFWETIDVVEGAGNSSQSINYESKDESPYDGINYYRLIQVDYNGEYTLSEVVSVDMNSDNELTVYPNPSDNEIFISSDSQIQEIQLLNGVGAILKSKKISQIENTSLSTYDIKDGLYVLRILLKNGDVKSKNVLIKH